MGYYGDTGARPTDESAAPGGDFLAELCVRWEHEAQQATSAATRVVLLRTGVLLDERGGALPKMMQPFRFLAGGPVGSGRQFVSWIHWRDLIGLIDLTLRDKNLSGPMNGVGPNPVTSREFAKALGAAMKRPALAPPVPWFVLRAALGELADFMVMSQRIIPAVAARRGYQFLYPLLEQALPDLIQAQRREPEARQRRGERRMRRAAPHRTSAAVVASRSIDRGGDALSAGPTLTHEPRPPAQVKLFAVDVDGTLLTSSGRLSPTVVQACRAAERAGCTVVLASGRPPRAIRSILQTLGTSGPSINHHGALIWDPVANQPIFHEPLDDELVRSIIAASRRIEPDLLLGLEVIDRWFTDKFDPKFGSEHMRLMQPDGIMPLEQALAQPITKLNLLREPIRLNAVMEMLDDLYVRSLRIRVQITNPHLLQLTHARADKGVALRVLAEQMGLGPAQVMAIGDAHNDLGMIEWAGFGLAIGNAHEEVKAAADVVVESNDEHGVAFAIQRYILL
jgi:Cof subfamily protein (haloacid dehalogenase superfamily)